MQDQAQALLDEFVQEWPKQPTKAFEELTTKLLNGVLEGEFSHQVAARCIASTTFIFGVDDDPLREEIIIVAGDLETGLPTDARHTWNYLTTLVQELGGK